MASRLFYQHTTASLASRRDFDTDAYYKGDNDSEGTSTGEGARTVQSTPSQRRAGNLLRNKPSVAADNRTAASATSAEAFYRQRDKIRGYHHGDDRSVGSAPSGSSSRKILRPSTLHRGTTSGDGRGGGASLASASSSRQHRRTTSGSSVASGQRSIASLSKNSVGSQSVPGGAGGGDHDLDSTPPIRTYPKWSPKRSTSTSPASSPAAGSVKRDTDSPGSRRIFSSASNRAGTPQRIFSASITTAKTPQRSPDKRIPMVVTPPVKEQDDPLSSENEGSPSRRASVELAIFATQFTPAERRAIIQDAIDWVRSFEFDDEQLNKSERRALIRLAGTRDISREKGESLEMATLTAAEFIHDNEPNYDVDDATLQELANFPINTQNAGSHHRHITSRQKERIIKKVVSWVRKNELRPNDLHDISLRALSKLAGRNLKYGPTAVEREQAFEYAVDWLQKHYPKIERVAGETARHLIDFPPNVSQAEKRAIAQKVQAWARCCAPRQAEIDPAVLQALVNLSGSDIAPGQLQEVREQALFEALEFLRHNNVDVTQISDSTARILRDWPPPVLLETKQRIAKTLTSWARNTDPRPQDVDNDFTLRALAKVSENNLKQDLSDFDRGIALGDACVWLRRYDPDPYMMDDNVARQLEQFPPLIAFEEKEKSLERIKEYARATDPRIEDTDYMTLKALVRLSSGGEFKSQPTQEESKRALKNVTRYLRDNDPDASTMDDNTARQLSAFPPYLSLEEKIAVAGAIHDWALSPYCLQEDVVDPMTRNSLLKLAGMRLHNDATEEEKKRALEKAIKWLRNSNLDVDRVDDNAIRQLRGFPPSLSAEEKAACARRIQDWARNTNPCSTDVDDPTLAALLRLAGKEAVAAEPPLETEDERQEALDKAISFFRVFDIDLEESIDDKTTRQLQGFPPVVSDSEKEQIIQNITTWARTTNPKVESVDDMTLKALAKTVGKSMPDDPSHAQRSEVLRVTSRCLRAYDPEVDQLDNNSALQLRNWPPPLSLKEKKKLVDAVVDWARKVDPKPSGIDFWTAKALATITGEPIKGDLTDEEDKKNAVNDAVSWLRENYPDVEQVDENAVRQLQDFPPPVTLEEKEKIIRAVVDWSRQTDPEVSDISSRTAKALATITGKQLEGELPSHEEQDNAVHEAVLWLQSNEPDVSNVDDYSAIQLANFLPSVPAKEKADIARAVEDYCRKVDVELDDVDDSTLRALVRTAGGKYLGRDLSRDQKEDALADAVNWIRNNDVDVHSFDDTSARQLGEKFPLVLSVEEKAAITARVVDWARTTDHKPKEISQRTVNALLRLCGENELMEEVSGEEKDEAIDLVVSSLRAVDPEVETLDVNTLMQLGRFPRPVPIEEKERVLEATVGWARYADEPSLEDIDGQLTLNALCRLSGTETGEPVTGEEQEQALVSAVSKLRDNAPDDPATLDDNVARQLGFFFPKIPDEECARVIDSVVEWARKTDPSLNDIRDVPTLRAICRLTGKDVPPVLSEEEKQAALDEAIWWLRENDSSEADDAAVRQLKDFLKPISTTEKARVATAVSGWARCTNDPGDLSPQVLSALVDLAGKELGREASRSEKDKALEDAMWWLRNHNPNPNHIRDVTARCLANFPRKIPNQERKRIILSAIDWLGSYDELRPDDFDDITLKALSSLAGLELKGSLTQGQREIMLDHAVKWLRENRDPNLEQISDNTVRALSQFPDSCLSPPLTAEEVTRIVGSSVDRVRTNSPSFEVLDRSLIRALAELALIPDVDGESTSEEELANVLEHIQTNGGDPSAIDGRTARDLARFLWVTKPSYFSPEQLQSIVDNLVTWVRSSYASAEELDQPMLRTMASLADISLGERVNSTERRRAFEDAVRWLKNKEPDLEKIDDSTAHELARFPCASIGRRLSPGEKRRIVEACVAYLRKNDPDPDVDDVSLMNMRRMTGKEVSGTKLSPAEKLAMLNSIVGWIRQNDIDADDVEDLTVESLCNITGTPLITRLEPNSRFVSSMSAVVAVPPLETSQSVSSSKTTKSQRGSFFRSLLKAEKNATLAKSGKASTRNKRSTRPVLISCKFNPSRGFSDFHVRKHKRVQAALIDFEKGKTTAVTLSRTIIEELFERDFWPGKHWEIDSARVWENTESEYPSYNVEKLATWDWKDIYSEASATAVIRFLPDRIQIENYAYCVAG